MTLTEINKKYKLYKRKTNVFSVYDFDYNFKCILHKKGSSFYIDGYKPTGDINKLETNINDYISKLKIPTFYLDPNKRDYHIIDSMVTNLLNECGFISSIYRGDTTFELKRDSIYGYNTTAILLSYHISEDLENIDINLWTDKYSWVTNKVNLKVMSFSENIKHAQNVEFNYNEIKKSIEGLLKPLLITEGVENIKLAETMGNGQIDYIFKELKGLDINSTNYNEVLKQKLLDIADKL